MASDRVTLKVEERSEFGSRSSRRLRRSGFVPGIVYGGGSDARHFQVSERDVRNVLVHGGALIDVELDGKSTPVVIKEQQRHPVRGNLLHLDLLEVKLDEAITSDVPIELLGTEDAPGVMEGGVLEHVTHTITISALPTAIPESIPAPEGVEFALGEDVDPEEVTTATLNPPRVEEEPEPEVEEEAELVGEEGEPVEGEEGEAPPEGEGEAPSEGEGDSGGDSGEE